MLVMPLQKNEVDGHYRDKWDLCFDPERGRFFVKHTTQHDQESGTLPTVEYVPTELCAEMISTKVRELGFELAEEKESFETDKERLAEI